MFEKLSIFIDLALGRPHMTTIKGHAGPINALSISPGGNLLASGGTDGVKIWDLGTKKEVTISRHHTRERTQISYLCWVTHPHDAALDTLCYGNVLGYLVFLQRPQDASHFDVVHSSRIAHGGEILHITTIFAEEGPTRIATSTRDKCVQVWTFDVKSHKLSPVHSKVYDKDKDIVPKALAFDTNQDLFVFGLYDGGVYKYSGKDSKSLMQQELKSMIGNAAVDLSKRIVVVDNVADGMDIYNLDTAEYVMTFLTKNISAKVFPKAVAFANRSRAVVGGSDHGVLYVFDRKTSHVIHSLEYARAGGVETLAAHDSSDDKYVLLAAASSTSPGATYIRLWKWKLKEGETTSAVKRVFRVFAIVLIVLTVIILCTLTLLRKHVSLSMKLVPETEDSLEQIDFVLRIPARWMSL